MEIKLINFNPMTSLKRITLAYVSGVLWNREIPHMPERGNLCNMFNNLKNIASKIAEKKVPLLPLPESVREELLQFVKQMQTAIWFWSHEFRGARNFRVKKLHTICWTQQGLINRQKTVELFLEDHQETIDITTQFELARLFCLEYRVWSLFKKLNNRQIESLEEVFRYYRDEWWRLSLLKEDISLIERLSPLDSYYESFRHAALNAQTVVGIKYFFGKLTATEAEAHLVETVVDVARQSYNDSQRHVVCFLFSHMNRAQQQEALERNPVGILECFLKWPWQSYFMKVADGTWDFLTEEHFHAVLLFIQSCMIPSIDHRQKLFKQFWLKSSPGQKEYITNDDKRIWELLSILIKNRDMENADLILDSTTADG